MFSKLRDKDNVKNTALFCQKHIFNKKNRCFYIRAIVLIVIGILCYYFVANNDNYYNRTIAKIISVSETEGNTKYIKNQQILAIIMNGNHKGEELKLKNTTSYSKISDLEYNVDDRIFVSITEDENNKIISSYISGYKRDKYLAYIAIIFAVLILLIGGFKGFKSLTSVIINILIFYSVIKLYMNGCNLWVITSVMSIIFIIISILIVSGINKKSLCAIVGTIISIIITMIITAIVVISTKSKGIYYEEMEFLMTSPDKIFFIGLMIGTIGGIMDIAITMSSSINELYYKNPDIDKKVLIKSGMEIGKDVMATMANTLVFVYISGSIPIILFWLRNRLSLSYIINIGINLEIIRALVGSIGVVISIPITMYISVILLKNSKIGVSDE
ncbi:membrane protein [Vallitalea longa]|uniref:Membrane protein n=1 Tax=Vallitalea longa TaxID=2936439 RepID=A0A9W6DDR9_9FIRM|nr:YibE/F family protein [Vallitalea longa]GKX27588.1 membrane protein [Vallitalea longa]